MRRRRAASSHRRRVFVLAAATTTLVVAAAFLFAALVHKRDVAAATRAREAARVVEAARAADASTWAGEELAAAEGALREAEIERRRQDARWWIPDYRGAEPLWRQAESLARVAVEAAGRRRAQAVVLADESITAAADAVAHSSGLSASIYAGSVALRALSEARLRLDEARIYRRDGNYTQAAASADQAFALTQRTNAHTTDAVRRYADGRLMRTWQDWKRETIEWSRRERRPAVVVAKEEHKVTLYVNGEVHRQYDAELGFNWVADKIQAGDGATPEGRYKVIQEKRGGATIYYKALLLDYPNALDKREFQAARRSGQVSARADIGGLIEIHGEGGRGEDWTKGCVALKNRDIDELMRFVGHGTPVTIIGSDGHGALASLVTEARPRGLAR